MSSAPPTYTVIFILLIFLVALLGSFLPLYLTPYRKFTRYGNAFAAGFLVAAAFVHLLPEAHAPLKHAFPAYPVDGLLALMGASAVFILDHVARHNHDHKFSSGRITLAYVLAATLSFHSLVEGLTLGFSMINKPRFTSIAIAIIAHKFFAALTLGSSLVSVTQEQGTNQSFRNAVYACIIFACVTPIGALLGVVAVEILTNSIGKAVTAGLSCLSAGVFLYVAFVELLAEEFREDIVIGYESLSREDDDTAQRAATFLIAAGTMSLLAVWA